MTVIINGDTGITSPADSLSGNLNFTGTGNRITGDFSNATVANRVAFQTSTVNGATNVAVLPNGSSVGSTLQAYSSSDPTNASWGGIGIPGTGTEVRISSGIQGTGTYLPMLFYTGGSERMRIDSSGNVGIGTNSPSSFPGKLSVIGDGIVTDYDLISRVSSSLADADRGFKQITDGTGQFSIYSPNGGGVVFGVGSSYTERMRIDSSGNVGIGTSSPSTNAILTTNGNISVAIPTRNAASANQIGVWTSDDPVSNSRAAITFATTSGASSSNSYISFSTNTYGVSGGERMRIDSSGNLLVGTTSAIAAGSEGVQIEPGSAIKLRLARNTTSTVSQAAFYNPNGPVGTIQTSGSSTLYNTSSDYRLKNTIAPMTGALAKVAALKPVTYKWNADGSDGEGFIAHELAEVVPQCVAGEKDAVDDEGNPVYQGIDTSFLVATLTAAIQEQQAIIEQLRADVAQLKGTQA